MSQKPVPPPAPTANADDALLYLEKRLVSLAKIADELVALMEEENILIERTNPEALNPLVKKKQLLVRDYQTAMTGLVGTPESRALLSEAHRQHLRQLCGRLDEATTTNALKLKAAANANERLLHIIVQAVRREQQSLNPYSAGSSQHIKGDKSAGPVAVNRML